jgi:signal transduction histidine kinase
MDSNQPAPLQEKIDNSRTLISKAIQDLRDLSKSLNTDYVVEQGLMRSIEYELEMIRKTGSYEIEFDTNGKAYRLERQQELIIFRIVQEILHNIIKHAKAAKINVVASFEPEIFMLAIADNGDGFDAGKIGSENYERFGLGIRNMHNRAKMINADFKFTSTLQEGTTVTLTLPITLNL